MPKKISEEQIKAMIDDFFNGMSLEFLSEKFNCKKTTISRHLKKNISADEYKKIIEINKNKVNYDLNNRKEINSELSQEMSNEISSSNNFLGDPSFIEISPLNFEIDNQPQKDFASVPISEVSFPKTVYMIVDKKIELEIKFLKDFPEWDFLPQDDLSRKAIEVFFDLNLAKRSCNKEQKVLKVPNTDVFRIASPLLIAKGISRIVCAENLISL